MTRKRLFAAALASAMAGSMLVPSSAQAAQTRETPTASAAAISSCVVPLNGCETNAVHATSAGKVSYEIYTTIFGCKYRIRDVVTGVVVRSGTAWRVEIGTVSGLTNWYRLELRECSPTDTGFIFGA